MPVYLKSVIYFLPLTHTNTLIRKTAMDPQAWVSLGVLVAYATVFFIYGAVLIRRYNE